MLTKMPDSLRIRQISTLYVFTLSPFNNTIYIPFIKDYFQVELMWLNQPTPHKPESPVNFMLYLSVFFDLLCLQFYCFLNCSTPAPCFVFLFEILDKFCTRCFQHACKTDRCHWSRKCIHCCEFKSLFSLLHSLCFSQSLKGKAQSDIAHSALLQLRCTCTYYLGAQGYTLASTNFYWVAFHHTFSFRINGFWGFFEMTQSTTTWWFDRWPFDWMGMGLRNTVHFEWFHKAVTERRVVFAHTSETSSDRATLIPVDAEDHDHERWPPVGCHSAAGPAHYQPRSWNSEL